MALEGGIMGEVRRHPYTSVAALACFVALTIGGPVVWPLKADAADVANLEGKLAAVEATVRRESAQNTLNDIQRELFDISLRIRTLERENINVDPLLYQRRENLQAQQRRLEAKLAAMDADP